MSSYIRQGSNQTQRLDCVLKGETISIQGSNGEVIIDGDVWGRITVQGSNPEVRIGGRIMASAVVTLQGSNAELTHHGREPGARVTLQGSNAEEKDLSRRSKKLINHRGLNDSATGHRWDYSSDTTTVSATGVRAGKIIIDGVDVTELLTGKPKVKAQDVPPTVPSGTLSVQKSQRPGNCGDLMAKFVLTVEIDDDHLAENRMDRVGWAIGCAADTISDRMKAGETWDGNSPPHLGGTSKVTGYWYLQEF